MTWKTSALNLKSSIQYFFRFPENLKQRSTYYRQQYGIVPEFKAGIHHGTVIRTQAGVTKKSVAYHGDAINTATRIQGICNELGKDLLLSAAVKDGLAESVGSFGLTCEGTYLLKGKGRKVDIFSVTERPQKVSTSLVGGPRKVQCKKIECHCSDCGLILFNL